MRLARHQELDNLSVIVDQNGLQGFGSTHEVADLFPLADKFRAFRLPTAEVDGHDHEALRFALDNVEWQPQVVVAETEDHARREILEAQAAFGTITPEVLDWAIRESGYSADEVADSRCRKTRSSSG